MDCLVILILFIVAVLVNLWAEARDREVLRYYSKPLLMPLLAMYYWIFSPQTDILVMIALWSAFAGDVLLLFSNRKVFFLLGLVSFLGCHICYIIYFVIADAFPSGIPPLFWFVLMAYILAGVFIFIKLRDQLGTMKIPVIVYMVVILAFGFLCAARCFKFHGTAFWLPFAGSLLFILSDTLLAWGRFKKTIAFGGVYIMITYLAAQLLLILGILAH